MESCLFAAVLYGYEIASQSNYNMAVMTQHVFLNILEQVEIQIHITC